MKRYGNLWPQIINFENLLLSARKAERGKRFRVFPDCIRVRNDNLRRARYRLKRLQKAYAKDSISFDRLTQSVQSWASHLKHGDTGHLREDIFEQLVFSKNSKN